MTRSINIYEAKARLSQLIREIEKNGNTVTICRNGKPVADLIRHQKKANPLIQDPALKGTRLRLAIGTKVMFLLDTHAFVWLVSDQKKLSESAKRLIGENAGNLFISSITAFEIALLVKRERLILPLAPSEFMDRAMVQHGIEEFFINRQILFHAVSLPDIHNDPFDRIIISTAHLSKMAIITKDRNIRSYLRITVVWD